MRRPIVRSLASLAIVGILSVTTPREWPVPGSSRNADTAGSLGANVSGLAIAGPTSLWAVRDGPGALLALDRVGQQWSLRAGWGSGRALLYPDGHAGPDAEAVATVAGDGDAVYVGAERDNANPSAPRNSVLRYTTAGEGALRATMEWRLDDLLPNASANAGIEGLAWISDEALVAVGFRDRSGSPYRPTDLAPHRGGLFVVGVEQQSELSFLALFDDGRAQVIATVASGSPSVMEVHWSDEYQELWAICDNTCEGRSAILRPSGGTFVPASIVRAPVGSASFNNEGFARLPCNAAQTLVVWADDTTSGGHVLRESALPCGPIAVASSSPSSTTSTGMPPTSALPTASSPAPNGDAAPAPESADMSRVSTVLGLSLLAVAAVCGAAWLGRRRRARTRASKPEAS